MEWFLGALLVAVAILWIIRQYRTLGVRPRLFVVGWYALYYGAMPPFLIHHPEYWNPRFSLLLSKETQVTAQLLAVAGLLALLIAFSIAEPAGQMGDAAHGVRRTDMALTKASPQNDPDPDFLRVVGLLVIGLFGYSLFLALNGGPMSVVQQISELRSTSGGSTRRILAAFFALGGHFVLLAAIYFTILDHRRESAKKMRFLTIGSWSVVFVSGLLSGGRSSLINVFIGGVLAYLVGRRILPKFRLAITGFIGFWVAIYGKSVLFQLGSANFGLRDALEVVRRTQRGGEIGAIAKEFSHPYLSLAQALERQDYGYRYFADYWYWLLKPFKLVGFSPPDSISYFNTYLTRGVSESEIPPGILGFGYLSFGVIGVVVHVLVVAFLVVGLERICVGRASVLGLAMLVYLCTALPAWVTASDPALFAQNTFPMLIPLYWIWKGGGRVERGNASARREGVASRSSTVSGRRPTPR